LEFVLGLAFIGLAVDGDLVGFSSGYGVAGNIGGFIDSAVEVSDLGGGPRIVATVVYGLSIYCAVAAPCAVCVFIADLGGLDEFVYVPHCIESGVVEGGFVYTIDCARKIDCTAVTNIITISSSWLY